MNILLRKLDDLFKFFYDPTSGYFPQVLQKLEIDVEQQKAATVYLQELRRAENDALCDMEDSAFLPRGSLRAK